MNDFETRIIDAETNCPVEQENNHNSTEREQHLLHNSKIVVVLLGAGISTSAGIPDFRSQNGLYAKYGGDLFHCLTLQHEPERIHCFVHDYHSENYAPTKGHQVLKTLQDAGILRSVLTQNIDGLEEQVGLERFKVVHLHGSLNEFRCTNHDCDGRLSGQEFKKFSTSRSMPLECYACNGSSLMRPEIVLFGEALNEAAIEYARLDLAACDTFICVGTSLKVQPVASMPMQHVPQSAKRIWINRDPPPPHYASFFTHQLLGDCDDMMQTLLPPAPPE